MSGQLHPVRRDLDFIPLRHRGETVVLVRDHLGLVPEGKALPADLYELLTLLDRASDLRDLQSELMRRAGGILVSRLEITRIIDALDAMYLLDSPRFREGRRLLREQFRSLGIRPASHCGLSYPSDLQGLKEMLSGILNGAGPHKGPRPKAVVAPHIDISVGKDLYARAYSALAGAEPKCVVILGVGHRMEKGMFSISAKAYETPLGRVETDQDAVQMLMDAGKGIVEEDDFAHRSEHSIEFQILFLQETLKSCFKIVPILCGHPAAHVSGYSRDAFLSEAGRLLSELRRLVCSHEKETIVVAGVDLSHIGPKFGHDMAASAMAPQAQAHDHKLLERLVNLDADGFWLESARVKDRYNVCGFSALATVLEILPPCRGSLLDYRMWNEDATNSAVSFAAAMFSELP